MEKVTIKVLGDDGKPVGLNADGTQTLKYTHVPSKEELQKEFDKTRDLINAMYDHAPNPSEKTEEGRKKQLKEIDEKQAELAKGFPIEVTGNLSADKKTFSITSVSAMGGKREELSKPLVASVDKGEISVTQNLDGIPLKKGAAPSVKPTAVQTERGKPMEVKTGAKGEGEGEAEGEGEGQEEGFFGKNKFGLGAGILGLILAMAMGMGPLGMLLIGLLAFGLGGMMGDKDGVANGMMGDGKKADPIAPAELEKAVEAPAKGKAKVLDDDGNPLGEKGRVVIEEKGADGKTADYIVGKVSADKKSFEVEQFVVVNGEGVIVNQGTPKQKTTLAINAEGEVDLNNKMLNEARNNAPKIVADYEKKHPKVRDQDHAPVVAAAAAAGAKATDKAAERAPSDDKVAVRADNKTQPKPQEPAKDDKIADKDKPAAKLADKDKKEGKGVSLDDAGRIALPLAVGGLPLGAVAMGSVTAIGGMLSQSGVSAEGLKDKALSGLSTLEKMAKEADRGQAPLQGQQAMFTVDKNGKFIRDENDGVLEQKAEPGSMQLHGRIAGGKFHITSVALADKDGNFPISKNDKVLFDNKLPKEITGVGLPVKDGQIELNDATSQKTLAQLNTYATGVQDKEHKHAETERQAIAARQEAARLKDLGMKPKVELLSSETDMVSKKTLVKIEYNSLDDEGKESKRVFEGHLEAREETKRGGGGKGQWSSKSTLHDLVITSSQAIVNGEPQDAVATDVTIKNVPMKKGQLDVNEMKNELGNGKQIGVEGSGRQAKAIYEKIVKDKNPILEEFDRVAAASKPAEKMDIATQVVGTAQRPQERGRE